VTIRLYFPLLACATLFAQAGADEEVLKQAIGMHQAGDIPGAINAYQQYLAAHPDSLIAHSNLGAAFSRSGRFQDAIVHYQRALELQPGNTGVELNLGLAYYKTNQKEKAAGAFAKVHEAAPGEMQPMLLLADCWLAMGRNKDVVELLAPLQSENLAVAYLLGTALVRDGQPVRGQAVIDRILRNGDSAEARLLLGTSKLAARDFPAALEDLKKAVALNPDLPDAQAYLGQVLQATGDPAAAAAAYQKALSANPNDFIANLQLAVLLKDESKVEESRRLLGRALLVRPGDLGARYQLATLDVAEEKVEAARSQLEAIVKEAPGYTSAHVTLATVYYRLKRKADGDRERAIVQKLNAAAQASESGK